MAVSNYLELLPAKLRTSKDGIALVERLERRDKTVSGLRSQLSDVMESRVVETIALVPGGAMMAGFVDRMVPKILGFIPVSQLVGIGVLAVGALIGMPWMVTLGSGMLAGGAYQGGAMAADFVNQSRGA